MAKERKYRNIKVVYENAPFPNSIEFHSFNGDRIDFLKTVVAPKLAKYGYSWSRRINLKPSHVMYHLGTAFPMKTVRRARGLPSQNADILNTIANGKAKPNEMAQMFVNFDNNFNTGNRSHVVPLRDIIVVRLINLHLKRKPKKVYNPHVSNVSGQGIS